MTPEKIVLRLWRFLTSNKVNPTGLPINFLTFIVLVLFCLFMFDFLRHFLPGFKDIGTLLDQVRALIDQLKSIYDKIVGLDDKIDILNDAMEKAKPTENISKPNGWSYLLKTIQDTAYQWWCGGANITLAILEGIWGVLFWQATLVADATNGVREFTNTMVQRAPGGTLGVCVSLLVCWAGCCVAVVFLRGYLALSKCIKAVLPGTWLMPEILSDRTIERVYDNVLQIALAPWAVFKKPFEDTQLRIDIQEMITKSLQEQQMNFNQQIADAKYVFSAGIRAQTNRVNVLLTDISKNFQIELSNLHAASRLLQAEVTTLSDNNRVLWNHIELKINILSEQIETLRSFTENQHDVFRTGVSGYIDEICIKQQASVDHLASLVQMGISASSANNVDGLEKSLLELSRFIQESFEDQSNSMLPLFNKQQEILNTLNEQKQLLYRTESEMLAQQQFSHVTGDSDIDHNSQTLRLGFNAAPDIIPSPTALDRLPSPPGPDRINCPFEPSLWALCQNYWFQCRRFWFDTFSAYAMENNTTEHLKITTYGTKSEVEDCAAVDNLTTDSSISEYLTNAPTAVIAPDEPLVEIASNKRESLADKLAKVMADSKAEAKQKLKELLETNNWDKNKTIVPTVSDRKLNQTDVASSSSHVIVQQTELKQTDEASSSSHGIVPYQAQPQAQLQAQPLKSVTDSVFDSGQVLLQQKAMDIKADVLIKHQNIINKPLKEQTDLELKLMADNFLLRKQLILQCAETSAQLNPPKQSWGRPFENSPKFEMSMPMPKSIYWNEANSSTHSRIATLRSILNNKFSPMVGNSNIPASNCSSKAEKLQSSCESEALALPIDANSSVFLPLMFRKFWELGEQSEIPKVVQPQLEIETFTRNQTANIETAKANIETAKAIVGTFKEVKVALKKFTVDLQTASEPFI